MTPTGRPTVTCGACGKTVAVKRDGTLWHHRGNEYGWVGAYRKKICYRSGWEAARAEAGESR